MANATFNKNELILDKVRSLVTYDLATKKMLFRLTSLEDSSLTCTAEGDEVTDAVGALITTLYRAKKASFSASNSLISLDLAAAQYGATKEIASSSSKITDYTYEILPVSGATVKLAHQPNVDSIKWIYTIENNEIGTAYAVGSIQNETEAKVGEDGTITLPTSVTSGKVYIEYTYESESAVRIRNRASQFPSACSAIIYAYFRDKCNENLVYSGKIICSKAKLNPEQIELALTSTGKHAFEMTMMKDYCAEEDEDELFSIIVSE